MSPHLDKFTMNSWCTLILNLKSDSSGVNMLSLVTSWPKPFCHIGTIISRSFKFKVIPTVNDCLICRHIWFQLVPTHIFWKVIKVYHFVEIFLANIFIWHFSAKCSYYIVCCSLSTFVMTFLLFWCF